MVNRAAQHYFGSIVLKTAEDVDDLCGEIELKKQQGWKLTKLRFNQQDVGIRRIRIEHLGFFAMERPV